MHHDVQCPLLHSPLHVTMHVLSNQYCTRESEIEQVPIYTSRREKLKRKRELTKHKIAQKWSSYYVQFKRGEKDTLRTRKATEMFKYIFVMTLMTFSIINVWCNVNMICNY